MQVKNKAQIEFEVDEILKTLCLFFSSIVPIFKGNEGWELKFVQPLWKTIYQSSWEQPYTLYSNKFILYKTQPPETKTLYSLSKMIHVSMYQKMIEYS